jgi:GAF domain-containing protein
MIRSVTSLLAVEIGQYCIADVVDRRGGLKRLEIEHADPSRRARLRVACEDASFEPNGRVAKLVASGGAECVARVSDAARARSFGDIQLLDGEKTRSYIAAAVHTNGSVVAVLTLVVAHGTRRYDDSDLVFLAGVADWLGLGLENATRREALPAKRASVPPRFSEETTGVRRNPLHERERERASR